MRGDVLDQRIGLELSEDFDFEETGVDEVIEDEIDDPVAPAERHGRFGSIPGERIQTLAHPTRQNESQYVSNAEYAVHGLVINLFFQYPEIGPVKQRTYQFTEYVVISTSKG